MDFVIIPAYNEGTTISAVITKTKRYAANIVVVDDGSTDSTFEQAQPAGIIALRHQVNLGKGAALKTGCEYAVQHGATKIIVMDADGQHDPKEIPRFLQALDKYDLALGSRQIPTSMPLVMKIGNRFISNSVKILYGLKVDDSQCGFRAFTASAYAQIRWEAQDYFVETEILIKAGKKRLQHTQVPIETIYADKYKGTTVLDGVMIIAKMLGGKLW